MPDEIPQSEPAKPVEPVKEKTPSEKLHEATQAYWKAIKAGDKELAAKIHAENKLPYHPTFHS